MTAFRHYCTFFLGDLFLGLDVGVVQEVLHHQELTKIPLAPAAIGGLINLRGQIVTAIDLRHRFEIPEPSAGPPMQVVVTADGEPMSILVDRIGEVIEVEESTFEDLPRVLAGSTRDLLEGAYKLEDRLLLVLDLKKVGQLSQAAGRESVS